MVQKGQLGIWLVAALVAAACGNKKADDKGTTGAPGHGAASGGTGGPGPIKNGGSAPAPGPTAAGGEVTTAPNVTDCPKSLGGSESVNRVITKACGVVPVTGDYHINNGTLTLEAGATLAFKDGAGLHIGYNDSAKLIVKGTADAPVTFTALGDKVPGVWGGLNLYSHADRSSIDHLIVEYAGDDANEAVKIEAPDVVWNNTTIRFAKGVGLRVGPHGTFAQFGGNSFDKIGKSPLTVGPTTVGGLGAGNKFPDGAVVDVYGGTIGGQVKWSSPGAPLRLEESVRIEGDNGARAVLEIAGGVELRMGPDGGFAVGYSAAATLKVSGTADAPVLFTTAGDKQPASWASVQVHASGEGTIAGAIFEYGGTKDGDGALQVIDGTISVTGSTFRHNTTGVSLNARAKIKAFDGNTFSANDKAAIWLTRRTSARSARPTPTTTRRRSRWSRAPSRRPRRGTRRPPPSSACRTGRCKGTPSSPSRRARTFSCATASAWTSAATTTRPCACSGSADKPIKLTGARDEAGA